MIGDRVVVHIHVVKFGIRSVSQFVSATLGLLTGPRVTDTDDSRESPLRSPNDLRCGFRKLKE